MPSENRRLKKNIYKGTFFSKHLAFEKDGPIFVTEIKNKHVLISFRSSLFHVWRFSLGDSFLGDIIRCLLFFVRTFLIQKIPANR
jgi:hypothetical protein